MARAQRAAAHDAKFTEEVQSGVLGHRRAQRIPEWITRLRETSADYHQVDVLQRCAFRSGTEAADADLWDTISPFGILLSQCVRG